MGIKFTGDKKAKFPAMLTKLEKMVDLHPAFKNAFSSLFGYTSDGGGIRHALAEDDRTVTAAEAKFMLVACSAFVNYIVGQMGPKIN